MIFERFFTPKYKSKEPSVRIQSIENLDVSKAGDKQILHELAFNDSHPGVTVAALEKLNSFSLWLKASEISEHKSVKNRASQRVLKELNDPNSPMINEQEFFVFCKELKSLSMLETLLLNNQRLQSNDELVIDSLARIDKENTRRIYFKQNASLSQRLAIVEGIENIAELTKLAKIDAQDEVVKLLERKVFELRELEAKPSKIKQAASLITSKLLAAKDIGDYSMLLEQQQQLLAEFESLKPDFSVLKEDESYEIAGKFLVVNESIEKRLLVLKEDWEKNQLLAQTTNEIAKVEEQVNEVISQIDALSIEQSEHDLVAQAKILKLSMQAASSRLVEIEQMPTTNAHKQWIKKLLSSLDMRQTELANLPLITELNHRASSMLEKFEEQLKLIESIQDIDSLAKAEEAARALKEEFNKELKQASVSLSSTIQDAWNKTNKTFWGQLKSLKTEQDKVKKQAVNKLKMVQRLIDQGKFKSAIASFSYAKDQFDGLNQAAKTQIEKIYQDVSSKVAELQDLQAFIAAPRKPALLEEASTLAQSAMNDVKERVDAVKKLRAQWTSLGQLGTEEDNALNEAFDAQIELAFGPCREHFAQQEKLREENKQRAEALLQQLNDMPTIQQTSALAKAFMALQKQWREIGQIENTEYKKLQQRYKKLSGPITQRLDEYYLQNEQAKYNLVKRAEALAKLEDLKLASAQAKDLQKEWRGIGYAGRKQDDKLWKQFRLANDNVFSQLAEKHNAHREATEAQLGAFYETMTTLENSLEQAQDVKALDELLLDVNAIELKVSEVEEKQRPRLFTSLNKLNGRISAKKTSLVQAADTNELELLFDVLSKWESACLPEAQACLSNKYQAAFTGKNSTQYSRKELTVIAEIIADESSIKADEKLRKTLQLNLMAAKLEGQSLFTLDEILIKWISKGPLLDEDSSLLKRLKKLFIPTDVSRVHKEAETD